ncbi:hypothetical protein [Streptomyces sp. NPDC048636]|uniref:hypothetical protein n=1 Tax=Streptomyces sp. NPDC048636 TaxID=3155762 RepID=UPI0034289984
MELSPAVAALWAGSGLRRRSCFSASFRARCCFESFQSGLLLIGRLVPDRTQKVDGLLPDPLLQLGGEVE